MNLSTAIMLFNKDIRAIATIYDLEPAPMPAHVTSQTPKIAVRTIYKTLDPTIAVGDLVVIPTDTRYKRSVVKVVATDIEVDYDSPVEIKWIISKLDNTEYEANLKKEIEMGDVIRSAEKRRKREELQASILKDNPEFAALAHRLAAPALTGGTIETPVATPGE